MTVSNRNGFPLLILTVSNRNGFPLLILTVFWKLFWIDRDTQREKEKIGLCGVKDNKRQGRTWHSYMSLSAAAQMLLPLLGVVWRFVQEKNCIITLSKHPLIMTSSMYWICIHIFILLPQFLQNFIFFFSRGLKIGNLNKLTLDDILFNLQSECLGNYSSHYVEVLSQMA